MALGCWGYLIASTLLPHVLHTRLDAGLLAILMFWAYAWTRSSKPEPGVSLWLAYFAIGLGISYKLIPIVMVPFLLLADWQAGRGWSRIRGPALGLAYLAVGAFLPFLPLLKSSGASVLNWLNFHAERGIEVESIYASLLMVLAPFGFEIKAVSKPWSWDIESNLADYLTSASTGIVALALAALGILAWFRRANYSRDDALRFASLAIVVTVTFSKVLSPQYLVWCLPLILVWGADLLRRPAYFGLIIASAVVAALSTAVFPYLFFAGSMKPGDGLDTICLVPTLSAWPVTLVVLRNGMLLGIVVLMVRRTLTSVGRPVGGPMVTVA